MFYDVFCRLSRAKGISPSRAAVEMGINKAAVTYWKKNDLIPSGEVLDKASRYFEVPVDLLLEREEAGRRVSDEEVKFALFGDNPSITDEMYEDVKRYARFLAEKGREKEVK